MDVSGVNVRAEVQDAERLSALAARVEALEGREAARDAQCENLRLVSVHQRWRLRLLREQIVGVRLRLWAVGVLCAFAGASLSWVYLHT